MAIKIFLLLLLLQFSFMSCTSVMIGNKECKAYGLLNKGYECNEVEYEKNKFYFIAGLVFIPTIIVPVWLWGYHLYKPVKKKE